MSSYPHDEFDEIPEDSKRRGAYRGKNADPGTSRKGFIALILIGILGLVLGAVMFVVQPRTLAPDTGNNISAAVESPSSSSTSENSQSDSPQDPSEVSIQIYNAGAYPGAAADVEEELKKAGYNVLGTANWSGEPVPYSIVYYSNGYVQEANTVTDGMGFSYFEEQADLSGNISVVIGPDFAGLAEGGFQANVAAQASATASETPTP